MSTTEKPSEEAKKELDELTRKSEFLEGVGVELKPEDYFNLGVDYYYKEAYGKSKEAFEKAIELEPDGVDAWYNRGVALGDLEQYEEAVKSSDKAIELKPGHTGAWYNRACAYSLKEDKGKSIENLRKALELDPKYKEKAKKDEYFRNLWNDEDFKKIVE